jgi:tRNA(Ser,Leu) C12 N-acetylase TAN1
MESSSPTKNWNAIATTRPGRFEDARKLLAELGSVGRTRYYNVLVLRCDDIDRLLADLVAVLVSAESPIESPLAHVRPARATFHFRSPEEFDELARRVALVWAPRLLGRSFHVRMHRRGFAHQLSSQQEEGFLDQLLLEALERGGDPGRIAFDDPDAVLAVDTLGGRAGLTLWSREELLRYPFLGVD